MTWPGTPRSRKIRDFESYAAERAIRFDRLDASEEDVRRLSVLDRMLAGKRIAYIGESDHFIHEKYAYRVLMLKYLAAHGFRWIGEELGVSDGARVDRFIATGDPSHLERVTIFGYKGAARTDRDDSPTGILREGWGDAYPQAAFAAEQKRFAHALRETSAGTESRANGDRLRFFGFDIDALPGGGYEDLAAILEPARSDAAVERIMDSLARVKGESIEDEIARLNRALELLASSMPHLDEILGADDAAGVWHSAICLRDSLEYVSKTYSARTWAELNPGMAYRERHMHRQVEHAIRDMGAAGRLALMSHNMHLCRDLSAVARSDAGAGPGVQDEPPLGTWLAARHSGAIFAVWMIIGRGRDSQPHRSLSNEIRERRGTLNAILGNLGERLVLPIDPGDPRTRLLFDVIEIAHDANTAVHTAIGKQCDAICFVRDVTPLGSGF